MGHRSATESNVSRLLGQGLGWHTKRADNLPDKKGEIVSDLTLPEMGQVFLQKEWVMDPPPWIVPLLQEDVIQQIYRIKMKRLAELARLEVQAMQVKVAMLDDIAKVLG